ncbi:uncharacterized protein LOC131642338 [Vicia villosa]|uniref:uncharacterized protein LOC131642338 n=1 Tax=Vicia villosa TaxID=3911 RepID=UPI00273A7A72|nr:uncharacterized protein LOC131642338 [Vicia villosa]
MELEESVREINDIDNLPLDVEEEAEEVRKANQKFWLNLKIRENMLIQRVRLKWLNDGDVNSKFFHAVMKKGLRRNFIGPISTSRGLHSSVEDVKAVVFEHFEDKFKETEGHRSVLEGDVFKILDANDKNSLEFPFEKDFHSGAVLSKSITSSFLALIPKSNNLLDLDDYRPICLVGWIHKIISKALAGRLKKVIGSVIFKSQSAFVPGRQLLDGVLVANEMVDFSIKEKKPCLLFKVDFEKANDKVNWAFLRSMMIRMGFVENWLRWMDALVFNSSMSVMVNGSPTKEFMVERGLRQCDPISPFLFVIIAEGLKVLVNIAVENGDFAGFSCKGGTFIDVLQFADDMILVGNGSWSHLWAIKSVLRAFELIPGLGINFHKSKLIRINISNNFMEVATNFLGCRREGKKFTFLGISICSNPRRISTWVSLVRKIKKRLASWKGWFLSFGGRLTILKSVSGSLAIFMLSFYKAPKKVIKDIVKIQSNLLWGGSEEKRCIHWARWDTVCLPIEKGGLGVRRIKDFNLALLCKWKWRILNHPDTLWYGVLIARYGDVNLTVVHGGDKCKGSVTKSPWWSDILSLELVRPLGFFNSTCKFTVGNGLIPSFWHSNWTLRGILEDLFPLLYYESYLQDVPMALMGGWRDATWGATSTINQQGASVWNALPPISRLLHQQGPSDSRDITAEMRLMLQVLDTVNLDPSKTDVAHLMADAEGLFSVKSSYRFINAGHILFGPSGNYDKAL